MKAQFDVKNKKKTISRNVLLNVISRIIYLAIGFVSRKLIIVFVAVEYLGLSSLYSNILDLLNLAELGIGVALQVCLFKPIINNDKDKIGNILAIARKIYFTIACIVLVGGAIITIFLPYIIKDNPFDENYVRIAFLISVGGVAFSYLCADKRLFFESNESLYIATLSDVITKIIAVGTGLALLAIFKEYLYYLGIISFQLFISNVILLALYNFKYDHHFIKDKPYQKSEFKKIRHNLKEVIPNKIGVFIFTSTDSIVITIFIGLTMVGIYSNYMILFLALLSMSSIVSNALVSTFGKMVKQNKTPDEIRAKFKYYEVLQFAFSSFTAICIYCLVDKFITIWLGADYLLETVPVILLSLDYLIHSLYQPMSTLFTSTEKFKEDKICSLIAAGLNIGLSVLLVILLPNDYKIIGVIAGTLIANIFTYIVRVRLIYGSYFKRSTLKRLLIGLIEISAVVGVAFGTSCILKLLSFENKWVDFIISTLICLALSNIPNLILLLLCIINPNGRNKIKAILKKYFGKSISKKRAKKAMKANKHRKNQNNEVMTICFICQTEHIFDKTKPVIDEAIKRKFRVILYIVNDDVTNYDKQTIFEKEYKQYCIKHENVALKSLKPDYAFYSRPYDDMLPKEIRSSEVVKYAKTCYIPYGYSLMNLGDINLSEKFTNNINFIFLDNDYTKNYVLDHRYPCLEKYNQLVDLGYPYFEALMNNKKKYIESSPNCFEGLKGKGLKIIWTPRWNSDVSVGGSNFLRYIDDFDNTFINNEKYRYVFRPHPYAFDHFIENNLMSKEEKENHINKIKASSNSCYDTTNAYIGTFNDSDALITDVSSIVPEYLLLNKPIIFCHNENGDNINDFAILMSKVFYNAYSFEDILSFVKNLNKGIDPLKIQREEYLKEFKTSFANCSKSIIDLLEKDYKKCREL